MEVRVQHGARATPFLQARDTFETEYDLELPVKVFVREDPDERTWTGHHPTHHVLNIGRAAAHGAMARELAIHEFSHMHRHEQGHSSHRQSTAEAIYLSAAGRRVPKARITQCYQIANHMKDIYADDLTVQVTPTDKLVRYLEASLAAAVAGNGHRPAIEAAERVTPRTDPDIAAVNAAFALGLVERHGLVEADHPLQHLARIAANDAPNVPFEQFHTLFRDLGRSPTSSEYRRWLVDATSIYLGTEQPAAD